VRTPDPESSPKVRSFVVEANEQNFDRLAAELARIASFATVTVSCPVLEFSGSQRTPPFVTSSRAERPQRFGVREPTPD
jgi:hypothetical protein